MIRQLYIFILIFKGEVMINEQVLLRKINEQLKGMPEARNRVKRLIYSGLGRFNQAARRGLQS
jgi:hypothetical protein